jgi:hypothetical protein
MHARDEKELFLAMQAFLLHFCNVYRSPDCYSPGVCHQGILPLDVERQSRRSLAEADRALKVNR